MEAAPGMERPSLMYRRARMTRRTEPYQGTRKAAEKYAG
jgi:hypothetical protein